MKSSCLRKLGCVLFIACLAFAFAGMAEADSAAKIGDTEYSTLRDAFLAAAASTGAVEMDILCDADLAAENYIISGKTVTIHGNNHTIALKGNTSSAEGCPSIQVKTDGILKMDQMTITGRNVNAYLYSLLTVDSGSAYLDKVSIKDHSPMGINTLGLVARIGSGGTLSMKDSKIENCLTTAGPEQLSAIAIDETGGTFIMNGGYIKNCGNNASSGYIYGGAVSAFPYNPGAVARIEIRDAEISNNHSSYGGGVFAEYAYAENCSLTLDHVAFSGNTAATAGGAVYIEGGTASITNCSMENNEGNGGGAVYVSGGSSLTITDNTITGNRADSGGGIYKAGDTTTVNMTGTNIICNNTATEKGADIYNDAGSLTVSSAQAMNRNYQSTRYLIDGWYSDANGARWSQANAFGSGNIYRGDTYTAAQGESLTAAFTPYSVLEITKTWDDNNDASGKRPDSITVTLLDSGTDQPVQKRTLTGGGDATVTLTPDASGAWKGTIDQLPLGVYSTGYHLSEVNVTNYDKTVSAITAKNASATTSDNDYGVYTASIGNVLTTHVNIYKIWDDANNRDGKRPTSLNTSLEQNGQVLKDIKGADAIVSLTEDAATKQWTKEIILKGDDYSKLAAYEGEIADYTKVSTNITYNDDGSITVVFINKHTLEAAASDTVRNDQMVEIHYKAGKTWTGENPVGDRQLPRPEITIILYADGVEYARQKIAANTSGDTPTTTFSNVPKYKDNDGNDPITYTIKEEITDSGWVKAGDNEWYSLDGMGKYTASIQDVTAADVGNTQALTVLTGGKITNTYAANQTNITVNVTKQWKDHQNENGVRPLYLKVGLFKDESDTDPVKTVTLTGPTNIDEWTGTFTGLPLYDDDGSVIDYSLYTIKEAYPATLNQDGTPASWNDWLKPGKSQTVTKNGAEYVYDYSVVTNP